MNTKGYISNMVLIVLCIVVTPMKQAVICKGRDLDFLSVSSNANTNAGKIIELWGPLLQRHRLNFTKSIIVTPKFFSCSKLA